MPTLKERLTQVVTELDREIRALAQRKGKARVVPKAHPPASEEEIKAYEEHLQIELPPSYRSFLECYNGYDWLAYPGSMFAIPDVMPGSDSYDTIVEWKRDEAEYGNAEVIDGIVIANLGEPNNWAFLDPNQPTGSGEFAVVRWLSGDTTNYADMIQFFEGRIRLCRQELPPAAEEADSDEEQDTEDE